MWCVAEGSRARHKTQGSETEEVKASFAPFLFRKNSYTSLRIQIHITTSRVHSTPQRSIVVGSKQFTGGGMSRVSARFKFWASVFIMLNLGTVLYMNTPFSLESLGNRILDTRLPYSISRVLRLGSWSLQRYAHLVALDSRWQMFGRQSHFSWRYLISAKYQNSDLVLLPLPRQSQRTGWQDFLFDFREAKFMLNLFQSREARRGWAYALCREYPLHEGSAIHSILFELETQTILPPSEALAGNTHLSPQVNRGVLDAFPCPKTESRQ